VIAISDDELAEEALAAHPDDLPDDAVPWTDVVDPGSAALLPSWYMPAPMQGARRLVGWRRALVFAVIVAFLAINAAGLCVTYGRIVIA
jgi:hypothetical protein